MRLLTLTALIFSFVTQFSWGNNQNKSEFISADIKSINIDCNTGSISIHENSDSKAHACWNATNQDTTDHLKPVFEDGVLKISSKKTSHAKNCPIHWYLLLRSHVPIKIHAGSCDVYMKKLKERVDINIGQEHIRSSAPLTYLSVNAGNVNGITHNLNADGHFDIGSGHLDVAWPKTPNTTKKIALNSGKANVIMRFPEQSAINVDDLKITPGPFGSKKSSNLLSSTSPNFIVSGALQWEK